MVRSKKLNRKNKNKIDIDRSNVIPTPRELKEREIEKIAVNPYNYCNDKDAHCTGIHRARESLVVHSPSVFTVQKVSMKTRPPLNFLPTYQLEPKLNRVFDPKIAVEIMKQLMEHRLSDFEYSPKTGEKLSMRLTEEIKVHIKAKKFNRYKIIVIVTLGGKENQSIKILSRCLWGEFDNYATYKYDSPEFYCIATVYAMYYD